MKSITSLSGGKSSAFMAIHWPTDYTLFSCVLTDDPAMAPKDPGVLRECQRRIPGFVASAEVELTLLNLLKLEEMLGREITWVCAYEGQNGVKPKDKEFLPTPLTFDGLIQEKKMLPNETKRFCTDQLKIQAMFWHLFTNVMDSEDDVLFVNVGLRADEPRRVEKMKRCESGQSKFPLLCDTQTKRNKWKTIEYSVVNCPMADAGITQVEVMKFWKDKGWAWPLYSNCAHCFHNSDKKLQYNERKHPEHIRWAVRMEDISGYSWKHKRPLTDRLSCTQSELFPSSEFTCFCTD